MSYKRGANNDPYMVMKIQEYLNVKPVDGIFGKLTEQAVINYQKDNNLIADGIVGRKTLECMGILESDTHNNVIFTKNVTINKHYLPEGEYIQEQVQIQNNYIVLHHTSGWNNPYKVVDDWARDDRGKIATEFVIGGIDITGNDRRYDGEIVKSFPDGCQGWHIGNSGSKYMNKHSVGIEMCSFGGLDGNHRTYTNKLCAISQSYDLEEPFRGYKSYHRYSDKQLYSLKNLILYVGVRDNIDVRNGLIKWIEKEGRKAFEFHQDAYDGKVHGLITHANIRKDKNDVFPQKELIDMLLTI